MVRNILGSVVLTAVLGCARQPPQPATSAESSAPVSGAHGPMAGSPMRWPGAPSSVEDTEGGVALTFATSPDRVADLRARVRQMAEQQGDAAECDAMMADGGAFVPGGMHGMMGNSQMQGHGMQGGGRMGWMVSDGGPPMHGMMQKQGMQVPADARVEDVDGGARLTLTAKDPADVAALRARVRAHVEHTKTGHCPMMW